MREQAPAESYQGPSEVVLAFLSNGTLCAMAYLSPDPPRLVKYESEDDDDEEEEEEEDASTHTVMGESSNTESSTDEDNEDETKEDGNDDWDYWEDDDTEKQEMKHGPAYSLKLKVWPSSGYANIVLFNEIAWICTTSYSLSWLSSIEAKIMVEKLADLSQVDRKMDKSVLVSNVMLPRRGEYEGEMVNSWAVQMFVKHKLSPSLYDFSDQKLLGIGAYSNVRLCKSRCDKKDYAIKIIKIQNYDPSEPREVSIFSSLRSQHVVKFLQECSFEDDARNSGKGSTHMKQPKYVLIHMELCPGSLENYLCTESRKIDAEALRIFKELVQGLQYIHGENIIHRDIKPANIFMGKDGRVKLGDFGQSCVRPEHGGLFKGTPYLGTVSYFAPELGKADNISEKVDVYSAGVVYFELFNLFKTMSQMSTEFNVFKTGDDSKINREVDLLLLKKMVASDPLERPSVDDLVEYISNL